MGYREVDMWEILEVLRRLGRAEPLAAIKQATGRSRKTIRRYGKLAAELGWMPGLGEPSEELAGAIVRRLRPVRKEVDLGPVEKKLLAEREKVRAWLEGDGMERGLRLSKVHRLLERQGVEVPYSSLHRFAVKHCGFADRRRLTVRMAPCQPGELAEVDFGRLGLLWDPETERRRVLHALIVALAYSRHMFVHLTFSQKYSDLIGGLEDAFFFFGGVVARVALDNLKSAVFKGDLYDPLFQRVFEEYAHYRGFVIDACVPRHPTGKPTVERNVSYVRENFFRGESFRDRSHAQEEALRWCLEIAGTRTHGTTRKRPLAVFENLEKAALRPLERGRFDPPVWGECKVHRDHHISFQKAIYSLPSKFVGKKVWARADRKLLRVYAAGELVKTHPLQAPGGRSTDFADYPKEKTAYAMRDPNRLIRAARERGEYMGQFMAELLSGTFPWANLRQGQKLLRLVEKYGAERLELACERALAFELINVRRLEKIVRDHLESKPPAGAKASILELPLRFAREPKSFTHPNQGDEKP